MQSLRRQPRLRLLTATVLLCALGWLSACGPGGGNNIAIPTRITGLVKQPSGSNQLAKPSALLRLYDWVIPKASALTAMEAVPGATVRLYTIDTNGEQFGAIIDQRSADINGNFSMVIPSWDLYNPSHPRVLAVGDAANGTLMRRLVDDLSSAATGRDIDPASEAAVRLLLDDNTIRFSDITPTELGNLNAQVAAAADAVSGRTIEEVVTLSLQAARESEGVQFKLIDITKTDHNTRPLARAGANKTLSTGTTTLIREAGFEDQDGDPITRVQWSVDLTPQGSTVPRTVSEGLSISLAPDVDGIYRIKLVVTDSKGAASPPDFATIIATTDPSTLTNNSRVDSEGHLSRDGSWLVYTSAVHNPRTNQSFTDVKLKNPATGFVGNDVFTYLVLDGRDGLGVGTVTVTVGANASGIPNITHEHLTTPLDTAITTPDVLINDSDPDGGTLVVQSADGFSLRGQTITDNGNGTYTYIPPTGFIGTDGFTYTVSDGQGAVAVGVVTIDVGAPINQAPIVVGEFLTARPNVAATTVPVLDNDTDPDGDLLSILLIDNTSVLGGSVRENPNGTLTYLPPNLIGHTILNPGVTSNITQSITAEAHPAISNDGTLAVYVTDMNHTNQSGGDDFDVVAAVLDPQASRLVSNTFWVTDADPVTAVNRHDTEPDVQCASPTFCTVVYESTLANGFRHIMMRNLIDSGGGFLVGSEVQLTQDDAHHFSPTLSRDGSKLVYVARNINSTDTDVELFMLDLLTPGATPQMLTDNQSNDDQPTVDLSGTKIAFHRLGQVWIIDTATLQEFAVSGSQLIANHPSVSENGTAVAFSAGTAAGSDLFIVQSSGLGLTQLTDDGTVSQPEISADASRILFRSARDGDHELFLLDVNN